MANCVNHNSFFIPEHLINDAVVAYPEFVEPCKVTGQCLETNRIQILSQPVNTLSDAAPCRLV